MNILKTELVSINNPFWNGIKYSVVALTVGFVTALPLGIFFAYFMFMPDLVLLIPVIIWPIIAVAIATYFMKSYVKNWSFTKEVFVGTLILPVIITIWLVSEDIKASVSGLEVASNILPLLTYSISTFLLNKA